MDFVKTLLDLEVPTGIQLSPDGQSVVYSTKLKLGHQNGDAAHSPIWLARTGEDKSAHRLSDGYNDRIPKWAQDSKSIAFVSDRGKQGKANAIYLWTLGDDEPRPLTPPDSEVKIPTLGFSPDGRQIAFIATQEKSQEMREKEEAKDDAFVWGEDWHYAGLHVVDVETGATRSLFEEDYHVDEFSWSVDGKEIAITTHRTPHVENNSVYGTDVRVVNVASGMAEKLCGVPGTAEDLVWAGSHIYFISNVEPFDDHSGCAVYSIARDARSGAPERVDIGEERCPIKLAQFGQGVAALVQHGMEDRLQVINGETLAADRRAILDFAGGSYGGGRILVTAHGDINHPTEVFSTNVSDGKRVQLSDHGKALEGRVFASVSFIECPTFDGKERVEGMFIAPARSVSPGGKPTQPLPTFVSAHGGPYVRITDAFDIPDMGKLFWHPLLDRGYGILVPNYRGSSGRGSRFARYAAGGVGIYDEPDIVAMTQYAIDQSLADKGKLLVGGWSQGGFLAYLSAVRNGKHGLGWQFKGAVAGAGVTDWDTMTLTSDIGYSEARMAGGEMWGMDKADVRTRSGSALWEFKDAAREGRIPALLMLHGEKDERVPISQAWGFRRALVKADLPFEFVTYPREGHSFRERKHIEDLIGRIVRFADTHLA